jgi:hypothetical protein
MAAELAITASRRFNATVLLVAEGLGTWRFTEADV